MHRLRIGISVEFQGRFHTEVQHGAKIQLHMTKMSQLETIAGQYGHFNHGVCIFLFIGVLYLAPHILVGCMGHGVHRCQIEVVLIFNLREVYASNQIYIIFKAHICE